MLRGSGRHATVEPDGRGGNAYILSIGGAEQSHVDLAAPQHVFYEYLRRIANVVDLAAPAGAPIRVLHLGAGALTLARYVAVTRPGSPQIAVEHERELMDFVLRQLPLPEGTELQVLIGDARAAVAEVPAGRFDVVVLDVFSGSDAPEHLTESDFYRECAELLGPAGVLLVNVGDDPPLRFAAGQVRALRQAGYDVAALADESMFTGRYPGNIVLAGTVDPWPPDWTERLLQAGPHPAAVRRGVDLDPLAAR